MLKVQKGALKFVGRKVEGVGVSVSFADMDSGEGLPDLPVIASSAPEFDLPYSLLASVSSRIAFAASEDRFRPILQNVLIQRLGDQVECVATNGHRLALLQDAAPDRMPDGLTVLLRPKALRTALRIFKGQENITVRTNVSYAELSAAGRTVVGRMGDGPYPAYKQVIPEKMPRLAWVSRASLVDALKTAMIAASEQTHRVALMFGDGVLSVEASNLLVGEVKAGVPVTTSDTEPFAIGFNGRYVLSALAHMKGDETQIGMSTPEKATMWKSDGEGEENYSQLLMPLRLIP
jgi:DNA polymerase-3 subunit beta